MSRDNSFLPKHQAVKI